MFTTDLLLCLPSYKCFLQMNPLNLHNNLSEELSSSHHTDEESDSEGSSEGLRNLLKVTEPASGRAGF